MAGNDTIDAVLGSAVIDPGAGADRVQGGRIVRARDGRRDTISSCGLAVADRLDAVSGCSRALSAAGVLAVNRVHHWYCNREAWKRHVREDLVPPALEGLELGDDVLEVGPGFGPATEVLAERAAT